MSRGKEDRRRVRLRRSAAVGLLAALLGVATDAAAQVITAGPVAVATGGDSASAPLLAVSSGGSASSSTYRPLNCPIISTPEPIVGPPVQLDFTLCNAQVNGAAVSGTGSASGVTAVSGTNTATGCTAVSANQASSGGCSGATVIGVNNSDDQVAGQPLPAFGAGNLQVEGNAFFTNTPVLGACQPLGWALDAGGAAGVLHFGAVSAGLTQAWLGFNGCENGINAAGSASGWFNGALGVGNPVSCTVSGGWYQRTGIALAGQLTGSCVVAGVSQPFNATLTGEFTPYATLSGWFSEAYVHISLAMVFTS